MSFAARRFATKTLGVALHGAFVAALGGVCGGAFHALPAQSKPKQGLAALARQAEKRGFRTGIVVLELASGRPRFLFRSKEAFIPASNQKLLTAAAALWGLGDEYRFETEFRLRAGVLEVLAGGDPNWAAGTDHDPAVILSRVAARLRLVDVTRVRGVRLVAGRFTGPIRPVGWPKDQFDKHYAAPTGGLVLEAGCFVARISAGSGAKAQVRLLAPPAAAVFGGGIKLTNKRKKRYAYWLSHAGDRFKAHGEFSRRGRPVEVRGVCQRPAWLFEQTVREMLRRGGVRFDPRCGLPEDRSVLRHESGLVEALRPMLADSSNFHAEQVLRVIGAERGSAGSFPGGASAVREILSRKLTLPAALRVVDGSGLSRGNEVTPRFVADLLRVLLRGAHGKTVLGALPQGGVNGTLKRRFGRSAWGRRVRAKTGTINGVKCLSGVVQTPGGAFRIFSILMNKRKGTSTRGASALQDAMVEAIYRGG